MFYNWGCPLGVSTLQTLRRGPFHLRPERLSID